MAKYVTKVVCIIIIGFCCAALITPSTCSNNETDVLALLAFKAAVVDSLGALISWNQTQHHCTWNGITCGLKHPDRVVNINLTSQGLMGSLSPHIGNLSFLKIINLRNNNFHGQIPQEIGRLRRLEYVGFSNNSFAGKIPRNISECSNLLYLNLISNKLSGIIPVELSSLQKLQQLGLANNYFSGSIPPFLGNLTTLNTLYLLSCGFRGEIPESLVQLQSMRYLSLAANNLTRIPSGLFNISNLLDFDVGDNQLQGVVPADIGLSLPNLVGLYLMNNQFSGEVPSSLSNATDLEQVSLYLNTFKGPMPKELGRLSNLQIFEIAGNLIQDDISFISSFTNCTKLRELLLSVNIFSGTLPNSISNFSSKLYDLEISGTQIHGTIPSDIGNLVGLNRILLEENNLEGPIPFSIGKLSNLRDIYLERNGFTNELPYSLGNLTLLSILRLEKNNLSGSIPRSLGNCTRLVSLNLSNNILGGSIPREIMSLSPISDFFDLSFNRFIGSIPSEVGSLIHLTNLDLSNNMLSGVIPNSLSACTSLVRLHLEGNLLAGEIPPVLGSLRSLQDLDLSRNNLSGQIPTFLTDLNLENLNLSYNRLKGEVPLEGVFKNSTIISLQGNIELCGRILDLNLPHCPSPPNPYKKKLPASSKILISALSAGAIFLTLLVCIFIFIYRQKVFRKKQSSTGSLDGAQVMRLSYGDISKATSGFSNDNLIGTGRFGVVYRGILEDGKTVVAVKVLKLIVKGASKSFFAECKALKGIRHRNLLKLLSVCESIDFERNEFKALIYEFMANGNLENLLHGPREHREQCLDMQTRLKIAIDIAHAVHYLHIGTDSPIIHGDLKPSNVLLDDDMTAHVGDFGLSKVVSSMLETRESSSTTCIKGTVGYIPPEYGTNNAVSVKGDVYSYGILLLELFTGKRPTDDGFDENLNLHDFVTNALPNHVAEIADPLIQEVDDMNYNEMECVASILSIGVECSKKVPMDRMSSMADVVHKLCKIRDHHMTEH